MRRPMTPLEFAHAVTEPSLTMDQIQAIIREDLDADLAAIQARREAAEAAQNEAAPPALTAHEEAAA